MTTISSWLCGTNRKTGPRFPPHRPDLPPSKACGAAKPPPPAFTNPSAGKLGAKNPLIFPYQYYCKINYLPLPPETIGTNPGKNRPFPPPKLSYVSRAKTGSSVYCLLEPPLFSVKLEPMRTKHPALRKKFLWKRFLPRPVAVRQRCVAVHQRHIREELRYTPETVTVKTDKYLALNGTSPAFFL
jgi:hypothetical protein